MAAHAQLVWWHCNKEEISKCMVVSLIGITFEEDSRA